MKNYNKRNLYFDDLHNQKDLKWLGQNTNHYKSHDYVISEMIQSIKSEEFHYYAPPLGLEELRTLVLNRLGLKNLVSLITDGAVSALYHICKELCSSTEQLITTDPTWAWPIHFAQSTGAEVIQIPIFGKEYNYTLDPDRLKGYISKNTKLLYLVDPNNPLGTCFSKEQILKIVEIAEDNDITIIHDCTYRDFADDHHLIANYYPENTITIWSFSKWLGLAGMRLGTIVTSEKIMEKIGQYPPNILGSNIVAQRGAIAGLKIMDEWFPRVFKLQRENQKNVFEMINNTKGFEIPIYPSNGNFVIIEIDDEEITPEAISSCYAEHKILVRQGSYHTKEFGNKFVKVSLSVPKEWVDEFINLFPSIISKSKNKTLNIQLY
jgi:aspartate/methionine/tyrosine aminotransferase